jgi:hypothetical protein
MPATSYESAWWAEQRRKDRRFNIMMSVVCAALLLLFVALVWVLVATEPQRRAEYMAHCQASGFTAEQCKLLYTERAREDADNAVAIGLSVTALGLAASRR